LLTFLQLSTTSFGEAQAIITIHDDCKLTLLPIPSFDILVGLVVERSVNVEDDEIVNKIERLVADTIVKPQ
jgi:hypothetical protein